MTAIGDLTSLLMLRGLSADEVRKALDLVQLHVKESTDIRWTSGGHPVDSVAERRRAYDRGRQRIRRDKLKNAHIDNTLTSLPSSDSSLEKKEGVGVARESKPRANRGQVVPADMQISIKNLDFAMSHGWPRDRAFREWERFRDGSISKGRVYKNFDAGWRNWVTSPYQKDAPGKFNLMSGIDGVI